MSAVKRRLSPELVEGSDDSWNPPEEDEVSESRGSKQSKSVTINTCDTNGSQPFVPMHVQRKLRRKEKQYYVHDDVRYYAKLDPLQQRSIDTMEACIASHNRLSVPLRFRILESNMDMSLKALAITKVDQLANLDPSSSEYYKMMTWVENLCKLPIGKYQPLPVSNLDDVDKIAGFLDGAKKKLDEVVYGHADAKDRIVRLLAKWISCPQSKGLVIGIEGVHGVGKTSLVKDGICQVLGLPFGFVTLGGISDGSYMVGHSYTYEGARWGKVADMLMKVGCMNPVLYFDELDKISHTTHGEEIANLLIHLTDSSQNDKFQDKYFTELDLDLSRCLIIFSYNHPEEINPILRDRMTVIKAHGYNAKDKVAIARDYMIPKILQEYGLTSKDISIPDDVISHIVHVTDAEEGVRNLKRSLEEIVSQANLHMLLGKPFGDMVHGDSPQRIIVTTKVVNKYILKKDTGSSTLPMMYI